MRFLNTGTLCFEEVADSELDRDENKYAILSHRWGADKEEVSFEDMQNAMDVSHKKGFAKIQGFCSLASGAGCRYAWIDTCCINKGNSTELSEAINSMYRWYQDSKICIVYLEDVPTKHMMESEWFERGWTLQELIGPKSLSFFDGDWKLIGTKDQLLEELSYATGIPERVLSHSTAPSSCSVAQRMSWAANRVTKRVEDRAYSLAGLFGVSMGQNYGERGNAFIRLQRCIIEDSKDESIFAWAMDATNTRPWSGLLAPSPCSFADCRDVRSTPGSSGFSVSNGELTIRLQTFPHSMETYFALLNCTEKPPSNRRLAIFIRRSSTDGEFLRIRDLRGISKILKTIPQTRTLIERLLRVSIDPKEPPLSRFYGFWLRTLEPPDHEHRQTTILSKHQPLDAEYVFLEEYNYGTAGIAHIEPKSKSAHSGWSKIRWIKFGFDVEFNPVLLLANGDKSSLDYQLSRLKPDEKVFEQAVASESGSQRDQIMNNSWIDVKAGVPSRSHGWPSGICILEVDRKKGWTGQIKALNLSISVQLQPYRSPMVASTEHVEGAESGGSGIGPKEIWVVDVTDNAGASPEREHFWSDCGQTAFTCFSVPLVFIGFACCLMQAKADRQQRRAVRDHRTRLGTK